MLTDCFIQKFLNITSSTQIPNKEDLQAKVVVLLNFRILNGDGAWYTIGIFVGRKDHFIVSSFEGHRFFMLGGIETDRHIDFSSDIGCQSVDIVSDSIEKMRDSFLK